MSIIVVLLGLMIAAIIVDEQSRDLSYLRDAMNYSLTNYEPGLTEEWDEIQRNVRDSGKCKKLNELMGGVGLHFLNGADFYNI